MATLDFLNWPSWASSVCLLLPPSMPVVVAAELPPQERRHAGEKPFSPPGCESRVCPTRVVEDSATNNLGIYLLSLHEVSPCFLCEVNSFFFKLLNGEGEKSRRLETRNCSRERKKIIH